MSVQNQKNWGAVSWLQLSAERQNCCALIVVVAFMDRRFFTNSKSQGHSKCIFQAFLFNGKWNNCCCFSLSVSILENGQNNYFHKLKFFYHYFSQLPIEEIYIVKLLRQQHRACLLLFSTNTIAWEWQAKMNKKHFRVSVDSVLKWQPRSRTWRSSTNW
jgi:hypothetical protein